MLRKEKNVLVNKFCYSNYGTKKIFYDPVAFLSGTMLDYN